MRASLLHGLAFLAIATAIAGCVSIINVRNNGNNNTTLINQTQTSTPTTTVTPPSSGGAKNLIP